jgi:hypothetical protein
MGVINMLKKSLFVLLAMTLLPIATATAAQKKSHKATAGKNCREQAMTSCPGFGMQRQYCVRAAIERCKSR